MPLNFNSSSSQEGGRTGRAPRAGRAPFTSLIAGEPASLATPGALDVDVNRPATCTGCGCTDRRACPGGCWWVQLDREKRTGLCSSCDPSQL